MRLVLLAALAALSVPGLASPAAAQPAAQAEDLQTLADFFLPGGVMTQMVREGCSTVYRTKLSRNANDVALERDLPGVRDKMVATASAHCNAEVAIAISSWQDSIKADWRASTSPADLHRLALLYGPSVREVQAMRLDVREGEMMRDAAQRVEAPAEEANARFHAAQIAFANTPGGAELLNRASEYQDRVQAEFSDQHGRLVAIIRGGITAAHRAANDYAREKGRNPPYPGQ